MLTLITIRTSTATLGRRIRRVVSMFQDIPALVREADRRAEEEVEEENEYDAELSADVKREYVYFYFCP